MSELRGMVERRPWPRAWLVVGLAAWATVGVLLVARANNLGLVEDITFSPYHVVGYAALATLGVYVVWTFFRSFRRGGWRQAFPPLYGSLGLAFVLLVSWVVLDPIWQATLGIEFGLEGGLAPPRLLIPLGLVLLAVGPVREALSERSDRNAPTTEHRVRWAGVLGAALVAAAATTTAFNPIATPLIDWAYLPNVDNSEIWVMNADGSRQTRLMSALGDGVDYSLPAWSPDGTRIAYTAWTNDDGAPQNTRFEDQTAAIWTMAADGSDTRLVVDGAAAAGGKADAWIPSWSPDGEWLTYTLTPKAQPSAVAPAPQPNQAPGPAGPPSQVLGSSIWIVRSDGTAARQLSVDGVDALGAMWAPDGERIAFNAAVPGQGSDIHVATVTDTGLADEAVLSPEGDDWGPAWSPDGATVAFVSNRSGNDDVWVATIGGGITGVRQLTADLASDWVPAYSPDGTRIAFVSDRTGEPEIWSMATDGSDLRNLTQHPGHFDETWSLSWAPDGSQLAYGNASFQDPVSSGWVRADLAAAQTLLYGVALSILGIILIALGAPAGSFAAALGIVFAAGAFLTDEWRFVPWGIGAGLLVDGLVRLVGPRWRARLAAAALPALAVLALAIPVAAAGTLWWSLTLTLGVAVTSGLIGWAIAEVAGRLGSTSKAEAVGDAASASA